jgi:hypothetical protein
MTKSTEQQIERNNQIEKTPTDDCAIHITSGTRHLLWIYHHFRTPLLPRHSIGKQSGVASRRISHSQ